MEPHTTTTTTDDNPVAIALLTKELEQLQLENDNFRLQNQNLKEQTAKLLDDANHDQKCIAGLQQSLEEAETEREHLEEQLYAHQQENDSLRQEVQVVARRQREAEKLHQKEVKMIEKERAVWMEKEVSYQEQLQTLQRQLHRALETQQEQQARTRQMIDDHETTSPLLDAQQRELNTARKNIREQDKLIMELREQIEQDHKSAIRLNEQYEAQAIRITILDNEIKQLKNMNQSLQEDNESYQILLQERTMNGDFMLRSISEGSQHERPTTSTTTTNTSTNGLGIDLAAELTRAMSPPSSPRRGSAPGLMGSLEQRLINENDRLKSEMKAAKDENKALTLYVNKILSRIMENRQLVDVLAQDYEQPTVVKEPVKPPTTSIRRRLSILVTPSMLSPRNNSSSKTNSTQLHRAPNTAGLVSSFS